MTVQAQGIYDYRFNIGHADTAVRATLRVEQESEFTEIIHLLVEADEPTVPPLWYSVPFIGRNSDA